MLSALLTAILPTFGIIGVGILCRRAGIWDRSAVHALNGYAYAIALPALIFQAVFEMDILANATTADLRYLLGLVLAHLVVAGAVVLILSRSQDRALRAVGPMLMTFGSTAYLGIPFATYAFGPVGTAYAAIGSVALVVVMLFVAIASMNAHASRTANPKTIQKILELPFLWVILLGLALPAVGVTALPEWLSATIGVLANSAGPTALLALGAFNYDLDLRTIPWRSALTLGIGKVALPTIATFAALSLLGVAGLPLAVGCALAGTSVAVTAFVLADEYRIGQPIVAGSLAVSTIASLLALSGIVLLWNSAVAP